MDSYHASEESFTSYSFEALMQFEAANIARYAAEELAKHNATNDDATANFHGSRMIAIAARGVKIKEAMKNVQPTLPTPPGSQTTDTNLGQYTPGNNSDRLAFQNKCTNSLKDCATFIGGNDVHQFIKNIEVKKDLICNPTDLAPRIQWLPGLFVATVMNSLLDTHVLIQLQQSGKQLTTFEELKSTLEATYGADESVYQRWSNFNASQPNHNEDFQAFCSRIHGATEDLKRNVKAAFKNAKKVEMTENDIWHCMGSYVVGAYLHANGEKDLGINTQVVAANLGQCTNALEVGRCIKSHMEACSLSQPNRVQVNRTLGNASGYNNPGRVKVNDNGERTFTSGQQRGHPMNPRYLGDKYDPNYRKSDPNYRKKKQGGQSYGNRRSDREVSHKADRKERSPNKSPRRSTPSTKQAKVAKQTGYSREVKVGMDVEDNPLL